MEPTISDPSVQQQFGMRVGIPNAGQLNALETINIRGERSVTLQGRVRRASFDWPAAGGCAAAVRGVPQAARRARARRRARRAVRQESRSASDADVLRRVLAQELVRREGHALHGRQRRQLCDGRAADGFAGHRATCAPRVRSSSPRRPPQETGLGFPTVPQPSRARGCRTATTPYAAWGGQALQSVRHGARAARHELRLRRVRLREYGCVLDLRARLGFVQRAGVAQQRRELPDDARPDDARRHEQPARSATGRASIAAPWRTSQRCSTP